MQSTLIEYTENFYLMDHTEQSKQNSKTSGVLIKAFFICYVKHLPTLTMIP